MITHCPSKPALYSIFFFLFSFFLVSPVSAAPPDGSGPWADSVVSANQGLLKNGNPVPAVRSDASSALGVAENDTADWHFYSLGFGGNIVLKFDNTQSEGVIVVEATNALPVYPIEKASVDVSENGTTWVFAGNLNQDGEVNVPQNVCVQYVRVKDISNSADFSDETADGYDVDGVKLTGTKCKPKGGDTTVIIKQETNCEVKQTNSTTVANTQSSSSPTGGNKIKNSTGGKNNITTGKAKSKNKVKVAGGSNIAVNPCNGCCEGGNITVNVGGTGSGSTGGSNNCTQ